MTPNSIAIVAILALFMMFVGAAIIWGLGGAIFAGGIWLMIGVSVEYVILISERLSIEAEHIIGLPDDSELPTAEDVRGILRN